MNNSFKADKILIDKIIEYYKDYQVDTTNDNLLFSAKNNNFSLVIYKTGTVFFQGKDKDIETSKWHVNVNPYVNITHMGSDEVGCGDYFGPVVVVSSIVKQEDYDLFCELGVNDSKKLSDIKIKEIAPILMKHIKYASFTLNPKKYNHLKDDLGYNLNKIKAYLHNFVLLKLKEKTKYEGMIVVDDFCGEDKFYEYLDDFKIKKVTDITFKTKAESSYLAVAASSIIARYLFIQKMDKMSKELGIDVPYGGQEVATNAAYLIAKDKGIDYLSSYVKLHFINTKRILEKL